MANVNDFADVCCIILESLLFKNYDVMKLKTKSVTPFQFQYNLSRFIAFTWLMLLQNKYKVHIQRIIQNLIVISFASLLYIELVLSPPLIHTPVPVQISQS